MVDAVLCMYHESMRHEVASILPTLMNFGPDYTQYISHWEYERCAFLLSVVMGSRDQHVHGHRRYALKRALWDRMKESGCIKVARIV